MYSSKVIITGEIGVGKSTFAVKVLESLNCDYTGYTTRKIIEKDRVIGFGLSEIGGETRIFAHIDFDKQVSFSKYGIDLDVFNNFGNSLLQRVISTQKPVLVDELGIMERQAIRFCRAVDEVMASDILTIAVVQNRALEFWLTRFNNICNPEVFEINTKNRDFILREIIDKIK